MNILFRLVGVNRTKHLRRIDCIVHFGLKSLQHGYVLYCTFGRVLRPLSFLIVIFHENVTN